MRQHLHSVALWWRLTLIGVPVVVAYLGVLFLLRPMERNRTRPQTRTAKTDACERDE